MTFASEIVEDAASLILVNEAEITLEPDEFSLGTRLLNDIGAELFAGGVDIGYRPVSSSGDPVTIPLAANLAMKEMLGIRLAPAMGVAIPVDLRINAKESERKLKALYMRRARRRMPTSLPMGSGNRPNIGDFAQFYPFAVPQGILRLDSTSTVTIATVDTPVIVAGWTVDRSVNVTALAAGTVEYLNDAPYLAKLEANFTIDSASGDDQFTFHFRKNSALIEQSGLSFDADADQGIVLHWVETLRRGDTVSIVVENNADTTDLVLTNGHFTVM